METIGGQAVIEGVMLRRKNSYSIAVRNPERKIIVKKFNIPEKRKGLLALFKLPFFRGMYALYEMFSIGAKALTYSSNVSLEETEEKISKPQLFFIFLVSFLLVIAFFIVLPYLLTTLLGIKESAKPILFNLVDAVIKVIFFVAYVMVIAQMKDIKRVFQYHGAEHKVVHCYEHGKKVTVENARKFSTIHSRCGSSFIMLAIVISIIIFSFLPLLVTIPSSRVLEKTVLALLRIAALPVIAAAAYELLKIAGKYSHNALMHAISYPGLLLQKLTTAEPSNKQIEVAIAAMNKLL